MNRRKFITLLGAAAAAWPLAALAQQPERVRRVAVLMGIFQGDSEGQARVSALRQGLEQLNLREGQNCALLGSKNRFGARARCERYTSHL